MKIPQQQRRVALPGAEGVTSAPTNEMIAGAFRPQPMTTPCPRTDVTSRLMRSFALATLTRWRVGGLTVHLPDGTTARAGTPDAEPHVTLWVHHGRLLREFLLRGDVGVGDAYVNGDWDVDDLPRFIELALLNGDAVGRESWIMRLLNVPNALLHAMRRNTRHGSRRNIGAHYDLSNDLFALFLDPSMTYSGAVFDRPDEPLVDAQARKFARFGRGLAIGPADHVLEIGCGWGSFALHAARTWGCRVTGITISKAQHTLARDRVRAAGLEHLVDIRFCDYRDVTGTFSRVVSIEMLEAVGRAHWSTFFAKVNEVLAPGGLVGIQVISVPDHRFEAYARRCDWIQKHIFPGGILPSIAELCRAMGARTPLVVRHLDDIGVHYADTLAVWRKTFLSRLSDVRALGLDDRFIRTWDYYLGSCAGAFRARAIGNLQLILGRAV